MIAVALDCRLLGTLQRFDPFGQSVEVRIWIQVVPAEHARSEVDVGEERRHDVDGRGTNADPATAGGWVPAVAGVR